MLIRPAVFAVWLLTAAAQLAAATPATMRVDYMHIGNALDEHYALERVVIEPLSWPGNPARPIDDSDRGQNLFEVIDPESGDVLYSRGFSTIFGEWRTTEEAQRMSRGLQESVRFPAPAKPVRIRILARDGRNAFSEVWSVAIDPNALDVQRATVPAPASPIAIRKSGKPADKVDLLILGDGYADPARFEADARRLSAHLFSVSPFKERADDFNVWALVVPSAVEGVSRPSTGTHRYTPLGARYDIFGSERYVLTLDNRALRELAQFAPYEFIEILVPNETYGGGGIFGQFSTAAASSDWANYLFVHEFGHHFAGLADEYYTSPVAYQAATTRIEPWEPNVTAMRDRTAVKWQHRVTSATSLPTDWPKAEYERYQRAHQKERVALREKKRPESEMSALFREELAWSAKLFAKSPNVAKVGAFEGANYEATGYYRPQMQCTMFSRTDTFCVVCQDAITAVIDLYTRPLKAVTP
ncbi:MAG: M64 family metallopeptidase [Lysobacterales bacterium]